MKRSQFAMLLAVLAVGIVARLWVAMTGYNFDFVSWQIVAEIVDRGGSVYTETYRYTTGPGWFNILRALEALPAFHPIPVVSLRIKICILLSLVDCGLALLLLSRHGLWSATIVLLNPVSILITGFHAQFDNFAILVGLLGVAALDRPARVPNVRTVAGLSIVGLSLVVKHIFFLLPLWLALREKNWRCRMLTVAVPYGLFALSFLPYWREAHQGIIDHVFRYRSIPNGDLWTLIPLARDAAFPLFVVSMLVLGGRWRTISPYELTLRYLCAVVVLTSAMANQYLAIPTAAIAAFPNPFFAAYVLLGGAYLIGSRDGLGVVALSPRTEADGGVIFLQFQILLVTLGAGAAWLVRTRARAEDESRRTSSPR